MKVLSGSSNSILAEHIAAQLEIDLVAADLSVFANNERRVHITDDVRGENIVLVQSFSDPTDTHIIEFLLMVDALERLGARHVTALIPWMGYSLQDKAFLRGEPISAKVIANLVSHAYVKRAVIFDLHNSSIPGFFSIPTVHVSAARLFADHIRESFAMQNVIVASPDFGGLKRARQFAELLDVDLVNIDKQRNLRTGEVTAHSVQGGSVSGKTVVLFDDCILSGGTVVEASALLKEQGANDVHFVATHGLFTGEALEKLANSTVDSVIITNSIYHPTLPPQVKVLDAAPIFLPELQPWM